MPNRHWQELVQEYPEWKSRFLEIVNQSHATQTARDFFLRHGCDLDSLCFALFAFTASDEIPITRAGTFRNDFRNDGDEIERLMVMLFSAAQSIHEARLGIRDLRKKYGILVPSEDILPLTLETRLTKVAKKCADDLAFSLVALRRAEKEKYDRRKEWLAIFVSFVGSKTTESIFPHLAELCEPAFRAQFLDPANPRTKVKVQIPSSNTLARYVARVRVYTSGDYIDGLANKVFPMKQPITPPFV